MHNSYGQLSIVLGEEKERKARSKSSSETTSRLVFDCSTAGLGKSAEDGLDAIIDNLSCIMVIESYGFQPTAIDTKLTLSKLEARAERHPGLSRMQMRCILARRGPVAECSGDGFRLRLCMRLDAG